MKSHCAGLLLCTSENFHTQEFKKNLNRMEKNKEILRSTKKIRVQKRSVQKSKGIRRGKSPKKKPDQA